MIVNFLWPSSAQYTGGVVVLYEFANALARRGVDVRFNHGPKGSWRVDSIDEITWFDFHPAIQHLLFDDLDDPAIPSGDVVFSPFVDARLGLPTVILQGHKMMATAWERPSWRFRGPKVVVARWLVDIGRMYGAPDEQLVHIPLGMDHDLFKVERAFDDRPYDVALLYNRHPAKGWEVGRSALERVRERRPDLRVCVFGIVEPSHDVPEWMEYRIARDRNVLASELLNGSKVILQSSWHEGFGLVAVEGMAAGCALVTTDNGGSEDYAIDGRTALVRPPGDREGLADAVERLLADADLRTRLAEAGGDVVRELTWDRAGERLHHFLREYVADPERFQAEPGTDRSDDVVPPEGWNAEDPVAELVRIDESGRLVVRSAPPSAVTGSPGPTPAVVDPGLQEDDLVWNVVWTGSVFDVLQYFVASQIAHSRGRFRFVVNGCAPGQFEAMEAFRRQHPDRVVEVLHVSDDMKPHGWALDQVRAVRDDGPCFCTIDPDIKARAPFATELLALLDGHGAVTSGKEVWNRDSVLPETEVGIAGEFFFDRDGFVFGSPHLAIYDRAALDATCDRWGVGLGSAGPDVPADTVARLEEVGRRFLVYDTAKVVNILLATDGHAIVHRDLPHLLHIGGLSHYISPSGYITTADGRQEPEWARWERVAPRLEVARYTANVLTSSIAGVEPAPAPQVADDHLSAALPLVRTEVVDLVERYRSSVVG